MADAPPAPDAMTEEQFSQLFEDCVARRDYVQALKVCNQRLKAKPKDRYAIELRKTVEAFIEATDELELDEDEEVAPLIEELSEKAEQASDRAFEAMFSFLLENDGDDRLWAIGEQAVGIFWDVGQVAPAGSARQVRLGEMSRELAKRLMRRLQTKNRESNGQDGLAEGEWLFEGLGEVWWCFELDLPREEWLMHGCREEWIKAKGSADALIGYTVDKLCDVPLGDLCDVLTGTWTVERTQVNDLLGVSQPALEFGVEQVFAEIRRRPLIEPPLKGFFQQFFVLTHVVYVLNCFNACLPNRRSDCPWVYALREAKSSSAIPGVEDIAAFTLRGEAVDAIAEAVDCLRGLDEEVSESDPVREAIVWLLSRQEEDGFFYSPGMKRPAASDYDQIHPTWTTAAALQLNRAPAANVSPRCKRWVQHARAAAQAVGFQNAPPPAKPPSMPGAY